MPVWKELSRTICAPRLNGVREHEIVDDPIAQQIEDAYSEVLRRAACFSVLARGSQYGIRGPPATNVPSISGRAGEETPSPARRPPLESGPPLANDILARSRARKVNLRAAVLTRD